MSIFFLYKLVELKLYYKIESVILQTIYWIEIIWPIGGGGIRAGVYNARVFMYIYIFIWHLSIYNYACAGTHTQITYLKISFSGIKIN